MPTPEQNRRHALNCSKGRASTGGAPRRLIWSRALPLGGVLAAVLMSAGWGGAAMAGTKPAAAVPALDSASPAQAIVTGEAALGKRPRNADLRATLGRAYLRMGRFESAATMLNDAMTLGDSSPRTVLSLALARTAIGQDRQAVALLRTAQNSLPVADYGLALALAGESGNGIALLSEAARAGQSNEKLRQNLAYAYALDGRWSEARTIVAMDLPADKVDDRLTQWAANARPDAVRQRVAALLGAPVVSDAGLPAVLALNGASNEHLAVKAPVSSPVISPVASPMPAPEKELPALTGDAAPMAPSSAQPAAQPAAQPSTAPMVEPAPDTMPTPSTMRAMGGVLASAEAPPAFTSVAPQGVSQPMVTYTPVSKPVASPLHLAPLHLAPLHVAVEKPHADKLRADKPRLEKLAFAKPAKIKAHEEEDAPRVATGTHLVQLGAFVTSVNAERARKAFLAKRPELRAHDVAITKAVVNGRDFWRVAASGFDSASASGACGRVKKAGGACFAYESGHLPAGQALAMAAPAAAPGRKR